MRAVLAALLAGLIGAGIMDWLASLGVRNLSRGDQLLVEMLLLMVGGLCGVWSGALVARGQPRVHSAMFGATTGALAGGASGAMYALVMGALYVSSFGGMPVSALDWVAVIVAYPVFGAIGWLIGMVPGTVLGLIGGSLVGRLARS